MLPIGAPRPRATTINTFHNSSLVIGMVIAMLSGLIGYYVGSGRAPYSTAAGGAGAYSTAPGDGQVPGAVPGTGEVPGGGAVPGGTLPGGTAPGGGTLPPGSSGGTPPGGTGGTPPGGTGGTGCKMLSCGTPTASAPGVSERSVRIGIATANLNNLHAAGFGVGPKADYNKILTAWKNEVDRLGGINGRTIDFVVGDFDVTSQDDMRAVCNDFADPNKLNAFAVFNPGGYDGDAQLCLAKDHKVPFIGVDPEPASWYQEAAPYLWSGGMSKDRIIKNQIDWLIATKQIGPDDKVGVIYHGIPQVLPTARDTLLPELARRGIKLALPAIELPKEDDQALAQINTAVTEMKRAGVTHVFYSLMNLIYKGQFMNAAKAQLWKPTYIANDTFFGCQDFTTAAYDASQYDRTKCLAFTNGGLANTAGGAVPNAWTKYADEVYQRTYSQGYATEGSSRQAQLDQAQINYVTGTLIMVMRNALLKAGTNPTRALFTKGMEMSGKINPATACAASWGPGKYDALDGYTIVEWHAEASEGFPERRYHRASNCYAAKY